MGSLPFPSLSSLFIISPLLHYKILPPAPHSSTHRSLKTISNSQPLTMARLNHAQQLAVLKSDNENLRSLNTRLLRDSTEKKREIINLLESNKSLECELARTRGEIADLVAELEAVRLASRVNAAKMFKMNLELEELRRSVARAQKKCFWTVAFSGTAVFAAAASFIYFSSH
ncbi:hypothetical protein Nepgr_001521 [Nepenthes gracilis]|uniref:Transmembrane protein n=1 Tax=Nepenthes gracilis TaxID=150966 RepID=A0AAD3P5B8_NEPGR|nr:hypothetical protein Nepgr_001521 [Nepenthes gracilis]